MVFLENERRSGLKISILKMIYENHYNAQQIACAMNTDINLVALKAAGLIHKGYDLHKIESNSIFLK